MVYYSNDKLIEIYKRKYIDKPKKSTRHPLYQTREGEILIGKDGKPLLLESTLQQQCKQEFENKFGDWRINKYSPMFVHIVNEMQVSTTGQRLAAGKKFKREGKVKGFPDIMILHERRSLFIELKAINGHIDNDQRMVAEYLKSQDFNYVLLQTNDVNDFIQIVDEWLLFVKSKNLI